MLPVTVVPRFHKCRAALSYSRITGLLFCQYSDRTAYDAWIINTQLVTGVFCSAA